MTKQHETNLYLSRLLLNPRSRQVMSELAHPYEMHRTLLRAFPNLAGDAQSKVREEYDILFRAEVDDRSYSVKVYVQSNAEPSWSFLDDLEGYALKHADKPGYESKDIMPAFKQIRNGQILSFRLRANPTKRIAKSDDPMLGKRVELTKEEDQIAWLIRKSLSIGDGVSGGFELLMKEAISEKGKTLLIPHVAVSPEGKQTGLKKNGDSGHSTTHYAVLFEGLLRVIDAEAFTGTIIRGIGSGKAFGFGLLSVAPVPSRSQR